MTELSLSKQFWSLKIKHPKVVFRPIEFKGGVCLKSSHMLQGCYQNTRDDGSRSVMISCKSWTHTFP